MDATGHPIRAWDGRGHTFRTGYDPLRRPVRSWVTGADPARPGAEILVERLVYGDQRPDVEVRNLRGSLHLRLDAAGASTTDRRDFKGNPLRFTRRLTRNYRGVVGWSPVDEALPPDPATPFDPSAVNRALAGILEAETFTTSSRYDALNRPTQLVAAHSDRPGATLNVVQPVHNEASLLERVHVWLDLPAEPTGPLDPATAEGTVGISDINYNARGQRLGIDYRNGASTRYGYDPLTFRLEELVTSRGAAFPADCPTPPPAAGWPGCAVQNLHYAYDPVGNVTSVRDDAQQRVFFGNQRVEPGAEFGYDALYRLVQATGREHLGQVAGVPSAATASTFDDGLRGRLAHPGDGGAMGTYVERYEYDDGHNIRAVRHQGSSPQHQGCRSGRG